MEKFKYNNIDNYQGMDIEEGFLSEIKNEIEIMNELEYFKLFFIDDILELLSRESNEYYQLFLKEKYGINYKDVILKEKKYSTYPYIYSKNNGIHKEDILAFIGIRIFMGLHQYQNIEDYWKDNILYECIVPKIMSKTFFKLISTTLHFPEKKFRKY